MYAKLREKGFRKLVNIVTAAGSRFPFPPVEVFPTDFRVHPTTSMSCGNFLGALRGYRRECSKIGQIAGPAMLINVLETFVLVVDVLFLGHLGRGNLAAFAIGTSFFNFSWLFIEGVLTAQDTLSAHAVGMNNTSDLRCWFFVAIVVSMLLCTLGTILSCFSYMIFVNVFQIAQHLAVKATIHVVLLIPNLWLLTGFRILQKYLMAQNILVPVVVCMLIGTCVNAFADFILISVVQLGFIGCGIATTLSRATMLVALFYYVMRQPDYVDLRAEVMDLASSTRKLLRPMLRLGFEVVMTRDTSRSKSKKRSKRRGSRNSSAVVPGTMEDEEGGEEGGVMNMQATRSGRRSSGSSGGYSRNSSTVVPGTMEDEEGGEEGGFVGMQTTRSGRRSSGGYSRNSSTVVPGTMEDEDGGEEEDDSIRNVDNVQLGLLGEHRHSSSSSSSVNQHVNHDNDPSYPHNASSRSAESVNTAGADEDGSSSHHNRSNHGVRDVLDDGMGDSLLGKHNTARVFVLKVLRFLLLGLPGGCLIALDTWVFDITLLMTASMGAIILSAQEILIVITLLVYMSIPFALSTASTYRIGYLLGGQRSEAAAISANITMVAGVLIMGLCGYVVYLLGGVLGWIVSPNDDAVQYRVTLLAPIVAGFQLAYGMQGCAQGALRAMGKQAELAGLTVACVWVVGLPTGGFDRHLNTG